jgi:methylthioribose-1-phosphate isomerase
VVGADRIAANGDVANKVGTLSHALSARYAGIPFVVAAPESTIDFATETGAGISIELRDADEVLALAGQRVAAPGSAGWNPAFDVTPSGLVTAIVTEHRTIDGRADAGSSAAADPDRNGSAPAADGSAPAAGGNSRIGLHSVPDAGFVPTGESRQG